jgi:excisionase family DNA binding protein
MAPGEDSRSAKGNPMEKISLIAWRRREKKFPETEAQRRARAREQSTDRGQGCMAVETLDVLAAVAPFELPEFEAVSLVGDIDSQASLQMSGLQGVGGKMEHASPEACVSLELTAAQRRSLQVLPLFSEGSEEDIPPALFQVRKSQDDRGVVLHFTLQTLVIPEMISLKELCRQLQVGRRTIMGLIRRGELRCYRVAHRYRFAVEDVKNFLERIETY